MIKSFGRWLAGAGLLAGMAIQAADQPPFEPPLEPVTNVLQVVKRAAQNPNTAYSIHLQGDVLWADPARGELVLRDASGTEQLQMDLRGQSVQPGQRVRLDGVGTIAVRASGFQLGIMGPVVDDDGIHIMTERSGSVYLRAGLHPLRVDYFNGPEGYGLKVEYQGPGLPRQDIPDAALFRVPPGAADSTTPVQHINAATKFLAGLDYACYPAPGEALPDFGQMTALKTGTVSNFNLGVLVQPEHVGLRFTGWLQVPRDGLYTFYLTSDDGSQLSLAEPPFYCEAVGPAQLPEPRPMTIGQIWTETDYQRVVVQGKVTFVSERSDGWTLELTAETGSLQMELAEVGGAGIPPEGFGQGARATALKPAGLMNSWVQVVGLCKKAYDVAGQKVGGILLVSGRHEIQILRPSELAPLPTSSRMSSPPMLTRAEEVHQLSREEAKRGYPVKLRGVVTCLLPERQAFTIQDASRGIYVQDYSPSRVVPPKIGNFVEIEGKTDSGLFAPIVGIDRVQVLGVGRLPQPVHPAWDQLLNGSLDGQYVELQGIIASVNTNGVTLLTGGGPIRLDLRVVGMQTADLDRYEDAVVRLRGCLFASWDYLTHQMKMGEIRIYGAEISVDQPAPADLFAIPRKTMAELLQFNPQASLFQRVKVTGQIIHAQARDYFLMDGKNGLKFILKKPVPGLECGDLVEVVGFPSLNGASPLLHEAVARKIGHAALPPPVKLQPGDLIRDEYDSTRVSVDGMLESVRETPGGLALEVRTGERAFLARLNAKTDTVRSLPAGCRLDLVGVYLGEGGDRAAGQDITSFELLLNSPEDIRVLARPPWWTLERLLVVIGILFCVLTAAALWITQLHRMVEQRTTELEAQIRQRQRVEQQGTLERERTRIAQDLHDELGSGITEISMLAVRAKLAAVSDERESRYMEQVREKAREMVATLDEIVWAINPRHDSLASLVSYFCLYADRFLGLANIAWRLEEQSGSSDCLVDSPRRHQLFLTFKEALTNVVRHSGATEVRLSIHSEAGQVRLTVADNGRGFAPSPPTEEMDGLANMRARIEKWGGRFEISADTGQGTIVRIHMPLSS